jgi:Uma2 family endonuclease
MATRVILTYEDYAALPADGRRYELHDGELSVTPAPSPRHQEISANLSGILREHVKSRGLGKVLYAPIDCLLSDTTIVQPDLIYLDGSRMSAISGRGIEGPPTLAVEILSPSTARIDRDVKLQLYARHGVPWYWLVDPDERTIEAHRLSAGAYEPAGRLEGIAPTALEPFPDLALAPASIWA